MTPPKMTDEERRLRAREAGRRYREANPEKCRERMTRWRRANPDKVRAATKRNYWNNRSKRLAYNARWHEEHKAERAAYAKAWRLEKLPSDPAWVEALRLKNVDYGLKARGKRKAFQNAPTIAKHSIYAAADVAVPSNLPKDVRDDAISAIVLAVLEGEISANDIPRVAKVFITAEYRARDHYRTLSLDAPIPGTDGLSRLETLAADPDALWLETAE